MDRLAGRAPTVWGTDIPGVVGRLAPDASLRRAVVLTFDACGGPRPGSPGCGVDRALIDVLRAHRARATFFLNARWVRANPQVTDELVADPLFEIGNHGTRHVPLSVTGRTAYGIRGTASVGEAYDEVAANHDLLTSFVGRAPRWFRPGTAFCDDVAVRVVTELGERPAGFSVNGDAGATFSPSQVARQLASARAGDIVISHVNHPQHGTAAGYAAGLPGLLARGLRPVTLSEAFG